MSTPCNKICSEHRPEKFFNRLGRFLDDPSFLPILERAVALNVPIYIHPGVPPAPVREAYYSGFDPVVNFSLSTAGWGWHSEVGIHALRLILAGVFDRLPTLQIIIGHMGEMIPFMLARINNVLTPAAKHLQHTVPEYFLQNFFITNNQRLLHRSPALAHPADHGGRSHCFLGRLSL